ncbi:hypothetical protein B0T11DRAFT_338925 [Plectosphaerella cucumerina]|uniref:F-box domain-containing protein n=1 Tax=Plectosphaerella cucumerina TaxID=40658 RepID=A0A8K0TDU3_9PEZI|nr:hypothetical protein B0T11DRAFT_338925 [Plectosphaerella cucumerina]
MNQTAMETAPFESVPLAPPGVTLNHFQAYIEETKALLAQRYPGAEFSNDMLAAVIKARAQKELESARAQEAALLRQGFVPPVVSEEELAGEGIIHDDDAINDSLLNGFDTQDWREAEDQESMEHERTRRLRMSNPLHAFQSSFGRMDVQFKLIDRLSESTELIVEVCRYLEPRDITTLYSVSKRFHETLDANITSSIRMWVRAHAEESGEIFSFRLYRKMCMPDPAGRTNGFSSLNPNPLDPAQNSVRLVPTLRWYEMVVLREDCIDDIIEALENAGHRLPYGMESTLKKMWLFMDVATNKGRRDMLQNQALWTTDDLYHGQMFFTKLNMYFADPIWPERGTNTMSALMLGQRGLWKLWQMLTGRAFKTREEYEQLKVRYDYVPTMQQFRTAMFGQRICGVHASEVGTVHLEGWGRGAGHLLRPDEFIPLEATRRGFTIDKHIIYMILWGRLDYPISEDVHIDLAEETFYECWGSESEDEGEDEDEDLEAWRILPPCEKAEIMQERAVTDLDRHYLERVHDAVTQARINNSPSDEQPRVSSLQSAAPIDFGDGIDFSALPDPNHIAPRIATLEAICATAVLKNHHETPVITPAIQAALDRASATVHRDVGLTDYVYRKLYGPVGVSLDPALMDKGDQAWVDYEQDDDDEAWSEYVEWINTPEDSDEEEEEDDEYAEFFQ